MCGEGSGVVASCIEPGLIERLGLRYVDLISPCEGHGMVDYVDPALRGFQIDPDKDREAYYIETITKTGEHKRFIHRYTETERGLGFLPTYCLQACASGKIPAVTAFSGYWIWIIF